MQITSPDLIFDPESFIECIPGGTPQVIYSNSACVILPDGMMHWQRPATLEWPSTNERAEILHLQKIADAYNTR